jgi:gliding motility-associated protein GldM
MSIPKEPRQQMINMMYLVLTALLALNVSAEILNAFKLVKDGLHTSNEAIEGKNTATMASFQKSMENDPKKTGPFFEDAQKVRTMTSEFITYVDEIETQLIKESGEYEDAEKTELKGKKNVDVTTRLMVDKKKGAELKDKISELKNNLVNLPSLKNLGDAEREEVLRNLTLNADFDPNSKSVKRLGKKTWEDYNFGRVPVIAVVTLLEKFKGDAKNSEAAILDKLYSKIDAASYKFDELSAKVIAPTSYILAGAEYTADIFVSATSSTQNPEVFIGRFNNQVKLGANGKLETVKTEQMPLADGYQTLKVEAGYGKFSDKTSSLGVKEVTGAVRVKKPQGDGFEYFPFKFEYTVAQAGVVVSPDKMNVFYIGVDNPVSISVPGFPAEKVTASISSGTIASAGAGGKYTVKVTQPGKANVTVSAKQLDGSTKAMGAVEFRVKRVPDPIAKIADQPGGSISASKFKVQRGMIAVLENFDFDIRFQIVGFEMTYGAKRQDLVSARTNAPLFDSKMLDFINRAKPGDVFYFDDIKAKGPDGTTRKLPSIAFKLI